VDEKGLVGVITISWQVERSLGRDLKEAMNGK
jgi:hypothetical protein